MMYLNKETGMYVLYGKFVNTLTLKEDDDEDKKEDCKVCDGTGGSAGNKDPKDDWICFACDGTGKAS